MSPCPRGGSSPRNQLRDSRPIDSGRAMPGTTFAQAGQDVQRLCRLLVPCHASQRAARGRDRLDTLFPGRTVAMLVPPWNRIAAPLVPHLPDLGFRWLSSFGRDPPSCPVPGLEQIDCQLDIVDWRARASRPHEQLTAELAALARERAPLSAPIGILSHHLDHDEAAWAFLAALFRLTTRHEAASWGWPDKGFAG